MHPILLKDTSAATMAFRGKPSSDTNRTQAAAIPPGPTID